jgi:hypothetical protein
MIRASIKITGSNPLLGAGRRSLGGKAPLPLSFGQDQMRQLAQFGLDTVITRTKRGIGSDDSSMPALSQKKSALKREGRFVRQRVGYAAWKSAHGLQPIRDLVGSGKEGGHMLDNASVRGVSEQSATIAFTARKARQKALSNEKRTPFFSFSPSDSRKIMEFAAKLFNAQVQAIARRTYRRAA